ncbi:large subunit GTPase 1 homolog [Melitaea cinxia]|uniref:large subunit GTPase 1 homolog n=1 Tax=Melitaea cinxia TaxID=113334 RepID=UPI001E27482E|nr:large subunit GTPase 1 homolog [Melitaea cinxia]
MGKKNKETLGRALIKDRYAKNRHRRHVEDNTMLHTTEVNDGYDWGRLNLQSVTAESSLQEFLSTAELANREFIAEKLNVKYVMSVPSPVEIATSQPDFDEPLTVPRRPPWKLGVTAEEQLTKERDSFLDWRRHLNDLQTKLGAAVTPYERNLELWKQLWRTLEKSDIVLILLDARNPLLLRCEDLEKYAAEQKCKCILLLNKADLTTEYVRKCWAEYFTKENIPIIFFSAAKSTKERKISEESKEAELNDDSETESIDSEDEGDDENPNALNEAQDDIELFKRQIEDLDKAVNNTANRIDSIQEALDEVLENLRLGKPIEPFRSIESTTNEETHLTENSNTNDVPRCSTEDVNEDVENDTNSYEIFDRDRLLQVLKKQKLNKLKNPPRLTVGMIGYPNVGKSSSVNVLMQSKKVSVSSMPGHTRHIQSLILDDSIELLDCPGLVLPAYAVAPDLLLTAVLPIDQMRSHDAAMARLCELVGRHTFQQKYGLLLPEYEGSEHEYKKILTAHAFNRGFMTAAGQPDVSRSARLFLKDAASGRLHWEQLPPGYDPAPIDSLVQEKKNETRKPTPREARAVEGWLNKSKEIDNSFFAMQKSGAHVKGKPILGVTAQADKPIVGKPWKHEKKHANKNKREKLRRVYAHLDEH